MKTTTQTRVSLADLARAVVGLFDRVARRRMTAAMRDTVSRYLGLLGQTDHSAAMLTATAVRDGLEVGSDAGALWRDLWNVAFAGHRLYNCGDPLGVACCDDLAGAGALADKLEEEGATPGAGHAVREACGYLWAASCSTVVQGDLSCLFHAMA